MKREVNNEEEELRLRNSEELMYGNRDSDEIFPFDVRMRFKYLVYHEALGTTEDGQVFSKKSTRRYSFFSPTQWDTSLAPKGQKSWFELQGKSYTILHDPLEQARLEGHKIKGYHIDNTGQSLKDKLRKAKRASDVGVANKPVIIEEVKQPVEEDLISVSGDVIQYDTIDRLDEVVVKKGGRPRKETVDNG